MYIYKVFLYLFLSLVGEKMFYKILFGLRTGQGWWYLLGEQKTEFQAVRSQFT